MADQERIAELEEENFALRQRVEYLSGTHTAWVEYWRATGAVLRKRIEQLNGENKRLRYRLKRLWMFRDARTKVPNFDGMWHDVRQGGVLVSPDGVEHEVISKQHLARDGWCVQIFGPQLHQVRSLKSLRAEGWHIRTTGLSY